MTKDTDEDKVSPGTKTKNKKKSMNRKKMIYYFLLTVFATVFVISSVMAVQIIVVGKKEQSEFDDLTEAVEEIREADYATYEELWEKRNALLTGKNSDYVGWLKLLNANVDYPVMWTPDDPEYYLHRSFEKKRTSAGTLFVGKESDINSDYFIIHGHNMKNGTMFGSLGNYKKASFYANEENQTFYFYTIEGIRKYQIFAAVKCRVLFSSESGYRYYNHAGDLTVDDFNELVNWLLKNSIYETGYCPEYGDQILVLSTCSSHTEEGRFVVAAYRIE